MICEEVFIPKKRMIIYNPYDIEKYIKLYDGKKNIYKSVYKYYDVPNAYTAIVDKIFLDFDYDDDMIFFDNVRKVAKYLHDLGAKYYIRFSGRGFHLFILLRDITLMNPKKAIRYWVNEVHKRTNTTSDMSVVGDTRRVSRALYTKNLKSKLYCIPIQYADLMNLSYDEICRMAQSNERTITNGDSLFPKYDYINGDALVDISGYDDEITAKRQKTSVDLSNIKIDINFPPCVKQLLNNSELGWNERRELIIYLRDDGYTYDEIVTFLKNTLSEDKFHHCMYEEHQVDYLLEREDILFSSCKTQKINGICGSKVCQGNNLYL